MSDEFSEGGNKGPVFPIQEKREQNTQMAELPSNPLDLPVAQFNQGLQRRGENRSALIRWVRNSLVEGVDFGTIPTKRGPSKPSLWKPGAEKICGMLSVTAQFPSIKEYEEAALNGVAIQNVIIRCQMISPNGQVVSEGVGARSLKQDYGDLNKALKMASKSAYIDATLRMGGLSEIFTLDIEDMPSAHVDQQQQAPQPKARRAPANKAPSQAQIKRLFAIAKANGVTNDQLKKLMKDEFNVEHTNDLTKAQYDALCDIHLNDYAKKHGPTQGEIDATVNQSSGGPAPEKPPIDGEWEREYAENEK